MASRTRKRKGRAVSNLFLLLPDKVEVRSKDEGFEGSWHQGSVIGRRRTGGFAARFDVQYDYLLDDDDRNRHHVDSLTVSLVQSSSSSSSSRGWIRPLPPELEIGDYSLPYGLCVDVNCNDGWWEGVIFDYENGSEQRRVFFPDIGDEKVVSIVELRISQDWDEVLGEWNRRGMWMFLELVEEYREGDGLLPVSIKQLWYDLRGKVGFQTIGAWDWTCSSRDVWEEFVLDAIRSNVELVSDHLFRELSLPCGEQKLLELAKSVSSDTNSGSHGKLLQLEAGIGSSDTSLDETNSGSHGRSNSKEPCSTAEGDELCAENLQIEYPTSSDSNQDDRTLAISSEDSMATSSAMETERDLSTSLLRRKQKFPWLPAGPDMVEEPKCCPEAIVEYAQGRRKYMVAKAKQHLLYLEWSIQYYEDEKKRSRLHFISPEGKCYYSLLEVCRNLVNSEGQNTEETTVEEALSSKDDDDPPHSRCPRAIVECYKVSCAGGASKNSAVIKSARYHLGAMGWKIEQTVRNTGRLVWVYKSPKGHLYTSLRLACRSCIYESDTSVASKAIGADVTRFSVGHGKSRTRKTAGIYSRLADTRKLTQPKHPRSSKRARRVVEVTPKSSQNHPLTVVSWLVDNNVILPREKVFYRTSKNGDPKPKGKVTREGIKCFCCKKVFSLSSFEVHVGNRFLRNFHGPTSSLFLADGRSLLDCQVQVMHDGKEKIPEGKPKRSKARCDGQNDDICSFCQYGGDLILCDQCPSSFHGSCLDHTACLKNTGVKDMDLDHKKGNWFCGKNCKRIFANLSANLGIPVPAGVDDLTWTLQKSVVESDGRAEFGVASDIEAEAQSYMKLAIALHVMHECFEPLEESTTGRDVVNDVIFSRMSQPRRLDFRGFYTMLLEKNDEVISVATIRIFGDNVAEVPLVATRHQYRNRGMCRILMNVIEKKLTELGVERLVLPAVPSMLNTWTGSFGFSKMTDSDRLQFVDSFFLSFPGTILCHKLLTTIASCPLKKETPSIPLHKNSQNGEEMDPHGSPSLVSEVVQADKPEQQHGAALLLSASEHPPISSKPVPVHQQPLVSSSGLSILVSSKKRSWYGESGLLKYHRRVKKKV
ncbi:Increased DNA methylation 1 [Linum perenne]